MRLIHILIISCLYLFIVFTSPAQAQSCNCPTATCPDVTECKTEYLTTSGCFQNIGNCPKCPDKPCTLTCVPDTKCGVDPYCYEVEGTTNACTQDCGNIDNCFEHKNIPFWCCPSNPTATPVPPGGGGGSCSCGTWTNGACGGGGCGANQRHQTRSCTPAGCDTESRCITDAACADIVPNYTFTVRLRTENDSYLSGGVCQQTNSTAQNIALGQIYVSGPNTALVAQLSNQNSAAFTLNRSGNYTVSVHVPMSSGLQFTCPTAFESGGTTYIATYYDIPISPTTNTTLNLFLRDNNLAADWFQVMGGLAYANNRLRSPVPSVTCGPHASCIDALLTLLTSSEPSSAGAPFLLASSALNLQTSDHQSTYHNYISPSNKTPNRNSYVTSFNLSRSSYQALRALIPPEELRSGSISENPFNWRTESWWQSGGDNFVEVTGDLTVTEASNYQITNGESLTVFVNGNLTLNDSDITTGNTVYKITSVAPGGFLAFIVSGNILISNQVGWPLAVPSSPSNIPAIPTLTQANANLEGVFIADGTLTLQSNAAVSAALPDRKFIGHGTFVGWGGVALNRSFDNGGNGAILSSVQAVENFIYRPDLLAKWPEALKSASSSWREISPNLVTTTSPFSLTLPAPSPTATPIFTPTPSPTPTPTPSPTPTPTPTQIFTDIPVDHFAYTATKVLYENGVISGCSTDPLAYCPDGGMRRDQAAVLMVRAKYGTSASFSLASPAVFADVPDGNLYRMHIEKIYNDGITSGCGSNPRIYCPINALKRDQAAFFLIKLKYGSSYVPSASTTPIFSDVSIDSVFRPYIEKLYTDGITGGCGFNPLRYCPGDDLTRAAMAVMLYRLYY